MSSNINLIGQSILNVNPTPAVPLTIQNHDPNAYDNKNFTLGWHWLNKLTGSLWYLSSLANNIATWIEISSGTGPVTTLHTQDGHNVTPTLGVINISGGNNLTTTGTVGPNTVTLSLSGITQHSLQVGGASNALTQLGVATNGQIPIGSTGVDPVLATITAGTGISVTNGAGSITIAASSAVAESFATDSGTATPAAGVLTVTGSSTGLTTTGSGSTVGLTGTLAVNHGGTSNTTFTAYSVLCAGTTSTGAFQNVSGLGTSGYVLTSNGAGALPTWQASGAIANAFNTINIQTFTSSGTYTPTANMQYCIIEVVGGGGGGGGGASAGGTSAAGGGGGAGGYSRGVFSVATIGASQSVTVGSAGSGGAAGGNDGSAGGTSSVGAGPLIQATGGNGAAHGSSQATFSSGIGGAGGVGSIGSVNSAGGPGTGGFAIGPTSGGGGYLACGGAGGSSIYGGGALGIEAGVGGGATNGNVGRVYGSGGGGGITTNGGGNAAGGNGSAGVVIITEFIS